MTSCLAAAARRLGAALAGLIVFTAAPALAQTTVTFNYTGAQQTWVVPAGVTSVQVLAEGAQGYDTANLGGRGGRATGTLAVTPGETLYIYVGGRGTVSTGANVIMGGGFNGGGNGMSNTTGAGIVGGGGGASDVRQGGFALTDRKLVGAGGGGSTSNGGATGGNGGGLTGANGGSCCASSIAQGGTQVAGGALGGGFGQGGNATVGLTPWIGGGGGGWYGGGTSDAHSGGAGGSSYYGGAGVTGGATVAGVRAGDGLVTITYTNPATIPTMSEWAMILFGLLLAGGAAVMIQQRRLA